MAFNENYPGFKNYEETIFRSLKRYFTNLPLNSLNYIDSTGIRIYKVVLKNGSGHLTIYSKINRIVTEQQIIEHVSYSLENGNSLDFEILKTGVGVIPSADLDLLTFNFNQTINDEFYQITIPKFKMQINRRLLKDGDKSTFLLGMMGFNVQLETHLGEHEANMSYIFFYKGMRHPQFSLTVKAFKKPAEWNSLHYNYLSSIDGELTPKLFFEGLNKGTSVFDSSVEIITYVMQKLGFTDFR
jgi:hypothetical protein